MYSFLVLYSYDRCDIFLLEKDSYTIGRNNNCDIYIPDPERFISKTHCTLQIIHENDDSYCLIIDGSLVTEQKSINGLWINGDRVYQVRLNHQDEITFGGGKVYPKIIFQINEQDFTGDTIPYERTQEDS